MANGYFGKLWDSAIGRHGYYRSALTNIQNHNYKTAARELTRAINMDSGGYVPLHECYLNRGICYYQIGNQLDAVSDLHRSIDLYTLYLREAEHSVANRIPIYERLGFAITTLATSYLQLRLSSTNLLYDDQIDDCEAMLYAIVSQARRELASYPERLECGRGHLLELEGYPKAIRILKKAFQ